MKLLLLAGSTFLSLICLEVGLRVHNGVVNPDREDPYIQRTYQRNDERVLRSEDGTLVTVKTNSLGFPGDEPKKGLVVLGDSFTAGREVNFDENYAYLLGASNFAIGGQGTGHALATFRHYAKPYAEKTILFFFMGNDFQENLTYEERQESSWLKKQARKSQLLYFLVTHLARTDFAPLLKGTVLTRTGDDSKNDIPLELRLLFTEDVENEKALQRTEEYIRALKAETDLTVVVLPISFQVDSEARKKLEDHYGITLAIGRPMLELERILKQNAIPFLIPTLTKDHYLCENGCHLNPKGHKEVQRAVEGYLTGNVL
ncbi:MAG TPA: SGNH/GDSL hydrolase family protein [Candidatus Paceibacterota bacterium]